jgi:hypothetical protein
MIRLGTPLVDRPPGPRGNAFEMQKAQWRRNSFERTYARNLLFSSNIHAINARHNVRGVANRDEPLQRPRRPLTSCAVVGVVGVTVPNN